jgi:tRNA(Ile)-lysidine synthase TilS/MesJ
MSTLYAAEYKTMMPKLHSTNFKGMELIRPLYKVREEDIISWKRYNDLQFIQCACRFTESCAADEGAGKSKRLEVKNLIRELKKINPHVDTNIFRSMHSVNLDTIVGYKKDGRKYSFLENYNSAVNEEE